ncbi:MAG: PAS domain-containing protein [Chloroflexi bacterium]|nr:PAS domain-containing protein [Chloroflexota bacterium]
MNKTGRTLAKQSNGKRRSQQVDLEKEIRKRTIQLEAATHHLAEQKSELRTLQAQYRTLIEQLPTITYVAAADPTGAPLYISPQVQSVLGFSQEEWVADPQRWAEQLHPEDRETVLSQYPHRFEGRDSFCAEYRLLSRDGRVLWLRDQATLVKDDLGKPMFVQGVMMDITDQKRAQALLALSDRFGTR